MMRDVLIGRFLSLYPHRTVEKIVAHAGIYILLSFNQDGRNTMDPFYYYDPATDSFSDFGVYGRPDAEEIYRKLGD